MVADQVTMIYAPHATFSDVHSRDYPQDSTKEVPLKREQLHLHQDVENRPVHPQAFAWSGHGERSQLPSGHRVSCKI